MTKNTNKKKGRGKGRGEINMIYMINMIYTPQINYYIQKKALGIQL